MLVVHCAAADVLISQVFPSGDMVELYNDGPAVNITGWSLMTEKSETDAILAGVMLPYSYYTIGDAGSGADWEEAISLYNSDSGVALVDEGVVDAVGWGEIEGLVLGSSAPNPGQLSLVRISRSGNNSADFAVLPPSFGKGVFAEVVVRDSYNWSISPGMVKHVEVPASSSVVWQGQEYFAENGLAVVPLHYTISGEHEIVVDGISQAVSISPTCFLQPRSKLFISGSASSSALGSVEFVNLGNVPCSPSLRNSTFDSISFSMESAVIGVNSSAFIPVVASLPEEVGVYRGRLLFE